MVCRVARRRRRILSSPLGIGILPPTDPPMRKHGVILRSIQEEAESYANSHAKSAPGNGRARSEPSTAVAKAGSGRDRPRSGDFGHGPKLLLKATGSRNGSPPDWPSP